jgi:hypothetical protein
MVLSSVLFYTVMGRREVDAAGAAAAAAAAAEHWHPLPAAQCMHHLFASGIHTTVGAAALHISIGKHMYASRLQGLVRHKTLVAFWTPPSVLLELPAGWLVPSKPCW